MKQLKLDLIQILAVAGVWQDEIYPQVLALWQEHGKKCRTCRYPDLHVKAYRHFLEQLFSAGPADEKEFSKGALSMFVSQAANLLEHIWTEWEKVSGTSRLDSAIQTLALFVPEKITPAGLSRELTESERKDARKVLKALFAVNDDGYPDYKHCIVALSYSDNGRLQKFSIRPMQFKFY